MRITHARIVTPEGVIEDGFVSVRGGRIEQVGPHGPGDDNGGDAESFDAAGAALLPGFIDLHNHGALGEDFMDARPGTLAKMAAFLVRWGVTGFLATTTASTNAALTGRLGAAAEAMASPPPGARLLGVHLEGPYLNASLCGMHPAEHCRRPDPAEYGPWLAGGVVRRVTASLELDGGEQLLAACRAAGVLLSLGHTACRAADVSRWADAGLRHVTHLYNAMSRAEKHGGPVRVCGCVEGALAERRIACEMIADGWHVPEHLFRVAALCKGPGGMTIASDATLLTGAVAEGVPTRYGGPDGPELIVRDGMATSLDGSALVGSVATVGQMAPRLMDWLDGDLPALAAVTSTNAADLLGLGESLGRIRPGCAADMVLLDASGRVLRTWTAGRCWPPAEPGAAPSG